MSKTEQATLPGHTNGIQALYFLPDGNLLAVASMDNIVRLWSVDKLKI